MNNRRRTYSSTNTKTKGNTKRFPLIRIIFALLFIYILYLTINNFLQKDKIQVEQQISEKAKLALLVDSNKVLKKSQASQYKVTTLNTGQKQISIEINLNDDIDDNISRLDHEAKFIAETLKMRYKGQLEKIVLSFFYNPNDSINSKLYSFKEELGNQSTFYYRRLKKNEINYNPLNNSLGKRQTVFWINSNDCIWNNICPEPPILNAAITLDSNFNYLGREKLLYHDSFVGIGESPVKMILDGRVVDYGNSDVFGNYVKFYNTQNIYTTYSGLGYIAPSLEKGDELKKGDVVGRLSSRDSSSFFLQILRDGKFVRFNQLYKETHPFKN